MEKVGFKLSPGGVSSPPPRGQEIQVKGSGKTQVGVQIQTVYRSF